MSITTKQGRQTAVIKPVQLRLNGPIVLVKTTTIYDEDGRVFQVIMNDVETITDPTRQDLTFTFFYDEQGNRSKVRYPSGMEKEWQRAYDADGALLSLSETQVGGNPWKTTHYDEDGLQTSFVDAVGNTIAYDYEDFRLKSQTYTVAGATQAAFNYRFQYDEDSFQLKQVDTFADSDTQTLLRSELRSYDVETGRLASVSKPEGTIDYRYDASGALAEMSYLGRTIGHEYDFFGRLAQLSAPEATWLYSYNDAGLKEVVENVTAGIVEEYEYDALGRLEDLRHVNVETNEIIFGINYHLGVDGTRIGATETRGAEVVEWQYEYDELLRLTRERRNADGDASFERDLSYSYDSDSNRVSITDHNDSAKNEIYSYEPNSQRLARVQRADGKITDYLWTENGELATETTNSVVEKIYTWGPDGTLQAVELPGDQMRVEYDYDDDGTLIARRATHLNTGQAIQERNFLVEEGSNVSGYSQTLAEIDSATGSVAVLNAFRPEGIGAQTKLEGGQAQPQWLLGDALGSVRALASEGSATEKYDYAAFGEGLRGDRAKTRYAFTGQVADKETGNQYHRARWLNKVIGRWFSVDSEWDFFGNQGNDTNYSASNPINFIDYDGHLSIMDTAASTIMTTSLNILSVAIDSLSLILPISNLLFGITKFALKGLNEVDLLFPSLMIGTDITGTWLIPGLNKVGALGISGGIEAVYLVKNDCWGAYRYSGFATSLQGGSGAFAGSIAIKYGLVWGLLNANDYEGPYFSTTINLAGFYLLMNLFWRYFGIGTDWKTIQIILDTWQKINRIATKLSTNFGSVTISFFHSGNYTGTTSDFESYGININVTQTSWGNGVGLFGGYGFSATNYVLLGSKCGTITKFTNSTIDFLDKFTNKNIPNFMENLVKSILNGLDPSSFLQIN